MKKIIVLIALLGTLGFIGTLIATAGPGGMTGYNANTTMMTTGTGSEQWQKFITETVELRKEIAVKRIELGALYYDENADQGKIDTLRKEIFDLQEELHQRMAEAGIGDGSWGYGMGGLGMMGYDNSTAPCLR